MAINIRTNLASLTAQRNLADVTFDLESSFRKLSSGLRITRAADDAAGLAIAEQLNSDSRIAAVAIRNANDGISLISIADSAMDQVANVLARMAELAEQSANGVYSVDQRSALALEFDALGSEVERIALTTEFNGLQLLSGGQEIALQVGFDGRSLSQINFSGVQATLAALGLAQQGSSAMIFSINAGTALEAQLAARTALDAMRDSISSVTRSRGSLGAAESRLNVAIANLQVARENFKSAEGQIRDADIALEAANLTRFNIRQQAAAAVLAQANQQPSLALSLIQ